MVAVVAADCNQEKAGAEGRILTKSVRREVAPPTG